MAESFKPEYKDEDEGVWDGIDDATGDDSNGKIKTGLWSRRSRPGERLLVSRRQTKDHQTLYEWKEDIRGKKRARKRKSRRERIR